MFMKEDMQNVSKRLKKDSPGEFGEIRENNGYKRICFFYDTKTFHGNKCDVSLNDKSALRYK